MPVALQTMMPRGVSWLSSRLYDGAANESDRLDAAVRSVLTDASRILDVGCGAGNNYAFDYRGQKRMVVGVDIDSSLRDNGKVDARVFASAERLPFADHSIDVAYSRYVFEHLADPLSVLREVVRVLRPGGTFIILTPNIHHYVSIVARITPTSFHRFFNAQLRGRRVDDTFPTLYRANSLPKITELTRLAGFRDVKVETFETRPNYLAWSMPSFLVGVAYERLVNSSELFRQLRVNILAIAQTPF